MIRARRFAGHVDLARQLFELGEKFAVALLGVGKLPTLTFKSDHQSIFGNIHSEIA